MIGTIIQERIMATTKLSFLSNLNKNPEARPANPVFTKTIKIVPNKLKDKKAPVVGANNTTTPFTIPINKPARGPYKIAPIEIGSKDKLKLTGPT